MREITPEIRSRTFLFDVPNSAGMVLRDLVLQIEISNRCLMFAKDEQERKNWAKVVLELEHKRIETILQMVAAVLGCPQEEVNKYLIALPIIDNTGQRIYVSLWEGALEQLQASNIMH